jgi:hypothetical protein
MRPSLSVLSVPLSTAALILLAACGGGDGGPMDPGGDPDDSYLVKKLEGRQSVGARMPLNGAALDNTDLSNIRNWISQGAKNN